MLNPPLKAKFDVATAAARYHVTIGLIHIKTAAKIGRQHTAQARIKDFLSYPYRKTYR